ncbi:MAG: DUF2007 domain-containing protein [Nitratireductor sp.]
MEELLQTNDVVLISFVQSLLKDQEIYCVVLDQHMSMLEGSLGMIQRRIMVDAEKHTQARRLLEDAGLEAELNELGRR